MSWVNFEHRGQKSFMSQSSDFIATSMKYVDELADDQWEYLQTSILVKSCKTEWAKIKPQVEPMCKQLQQGCH